ncbi:MAG: LTA synthase family protein [Spirochaetaceae bacterium]
MKQMERGIRRILSVKEHRLQLFLLIFTLGYLVKYNYLSVFIFNVPFAGGLIARNLVFLLLIYGIALPLIYNRRVRYLLMMFLVLLTIFCISTLWYSRYFGNYLSISDILMGRGIRPFKVLLFQIGRISDVLFLADIVALFVLNRNMDTSALGKLWAESGMRRRSLICALAAAVLLTVQIYGSQALLGREKPFLLYNRSTPAFVGVYGIIPLYAYEIYMMQFVSRDKIRELQSPAPEKEVGLNGREIEKGEEIVEERQNIIAIQVESLDERIIDHSHNGKEVTPFLNRLKKNSLYFERIYAQHVNGSFDAEFSFLTSIYPINKNYGFKINDLSKFVSLVKILKDKGYTAQAFHGNDKTFFHREKAFPELGFDAFYSREDFSFEDRLMVIDKNSFGINDYDFFLQSFDYLKQAQEPFFAFFITVTSHTPFDFYPPETVVEEFEEIENPLVRDYFQSLAFVDSSLEMFFEKLENAGLDKNTLILIYSDHEAAIDKPEYSSHEDFELRANMKPPEHIPLFIIHPDIKEGVNRKEGTTTDLAPTVLDIIGEKKMPKEFMGNSLVKEERHPVLFLHETPQVLFDGQLFALFPMETEKIGYSKEIGDKEVEIPNRDDVTATIEYMQSIILRRREEDSSY